jgi:hypothetical protein
MNLSLGGRTRAAFVSAAVAGLTLLAAVPANAAGGTPQTPTELFNSLQACSTDANAPVYAPSRGLGGGGGLELEGIASDTDTTVANLTEQFQYWPVSNPTQISTASNQYAWHGSESSVNVGPLTDGQTYAWQARTVDPNSGAASAWSAPCYVADDDTAPSAAPTISSANYAQGQWNQGGAPVQFTFGSNGAGDVAGYQYIWGWQDFPIVGAANIGPNGIPQFEDPYTTGNQYSGAVRANGLGGSASVNLVPPANWTASGYLTLSVRSIDRAYNVGAPTSYHFFVKPTAPAIAQLSHSPQFGAPTSFKLTADPGLQAASPVTSFTVSDLTSSSNLKPVTVPASAIGTATANLPLDGAYGDVLQVTSTSADGWVSETQWWNNGYVDTTPTVTSAVYPENGSGGGANVPGTFTFTPKIKGDVIAGYSYSFDWNANTTVAAGAHGVGQISWTPDASGWHMLTVTPITTSGVQLASYYYSFTVN